MNAPSIQLLRTLRNATSPSLSSTAARPCPVRHMPRRRPLPARCFSTAAALSAGRATRSTDRGPASKEDTQTDFGAMDVLGNAPPPAAAVDACLADGFHLDNGVKITGGSGCLLVAGEPFCWRPWEAQAGGGGRAGMVNAKGQWGVSEEAWGLLDLVWPKPDMLILGLGASVYPISPETRKHINALGIRVEIQDTRNAAAQFNLLATERGVSNIAAALIPIGWKGN